MRSVPEPSTSANLSLVALRNRLIALTVALADELAAHGDGDRLAALAALYEETRGALHQSADHTPHALRVVR